MMATLVSGNHSYGETGVRARYCFKICRAVDFFGSAGCTHDNEASIKFAVTREQLLGA
jgi:hypothetical protein